MNIMNSLSEDLIMKTGASAGLLGAVAVIVSLWLMWSITGQPDNTAVIALLKRFMAFAMAMAALLAASAGWLAYHDCYGAEAVARSHRSGGVRALTEERSISSTLPAITDDLGDWRTIVPPKP